MIRRNTRKPGLAKAFRSNGHNQLRVGDLAYNRLRSGFVYLAVLIDAWSRRVVGYAVLQSKSVRVTLAALSAAVRDRSPTAGLNEPTRYAD